MLDARSHDARVEDLELYVEHLAERFGLRSFEVGARLNLLSRFVREAGRPEEAIAVARRALSIFEETLEPGSHWIGFALHTLSSAFLESGRRDEALRTAERALEPSLFMVRKKRSMTAMLPCCPTPSGVSRGCGSRSGHSPRGVGAQFTRPGELWRSPLRFGHRRSECSGMNSRVCPKCKTKYRVTNWAEYDRALVRRGDITLWLSEDAIASWRPVASGRRGAPQKFSDHAIETALALRLVFKLPLRQAEGFLRLILSLMHADLEAPDHTTLSRRSQRLDIKLDLAVTYSPMHLVVDSTGLSIVGEGEWAAAKHGGRGKRGWKKLHLGVDGDGVIVAQVLTDGAADDAKAGVNLIADVAGEIASVTADAAYDTVAIYEAAASRGATVVVPPTRTAKVTRRRPRCAARDRTIRRVAKLGRRRWKKESGFHRQGRVENAFFRYKGIISDRLRARHADAQEAEVVIACNILNRMIALGPPVSSAVEP